MLEVSLQSQSILIYCSNILCLLANLAELSCQLAVLNPHLVMLQETWLNKDIEDVSLPNYRIISRRDRSSSENRGGVITFARTDVHNVVFISESDIAERSAHLKWLTSHPFSLN